MNYTYNQNQLVKETVFETFDDDGKVTSREVTREYAPVPQTGWWQNPVVSHNTIDTRLFETKLAGPIYTTDELD